MTAQSVKKCTKCEESFPLDTAHFRERRRQARVFWNSSCRECERKYTKSYCSNNPERRAKSVDRWRKLNADRYAKSTKQRKQKYYAENRDEILLKQKNYQGRPDIKERVRAYKKTWARKRIPERRASEPAFKLRDYISNAVRAGLKKCGSSKRRKSVWSFLGYSPAELSRHLENQFEPWMNWDNHGVPKDNRKTWHIDHIIPQSWLPYDSMDHPNFKRCWALENLRPLEAIQNISEGARRV